VSADLAEPGGKQGLPCFVAVLELAQPLAGSTSRVRIGGRERLRAEKVKPHRLVTGCKRPRGLI
jgi:hypothetical protein